MTKNEALKRIIEADKLYLNNDQKIIAKKIISNLSENDDIQGYFDFIMKRTGLGFKFDVSPELANGRIAFITEKEDMRINLSDDYKLNDNKLIIGENYEALKNLLITHRNSIDLIYIDPPYNTEAALSDGNNDSSKEENNSGKFIYKDKFGRNGWLNMLRERLILAKKLLSSKGILFCSIDDNEQAYLKILFDEIFGENNNDTIIWRKTEEGVSSGGTMKITTTFRKDHEYIHVAYSDKKNFKWRKVKELPNFKNPYSNPDNDHRGKYKAGAITMKGSTSSENYYSIQSPSGEIHNRVWRISKEEFDILNLDKRIYYGKNGKAVPTLKIFLNEEKTVTPISILENLSSTFEANNYLETILGHKKFKTTKPIELIQFLIHHASEENATILDFFAGSGTTGEAVLKLNREQNAKRNFILVTNNENNISFDITYERFFRINTGNSRIKKYDFKWKEKNEIYKSNLRVFDIKHQDVSLDSDHLIEAIADEALSNLKKINPKYKTNKINIYYDLSGLNPYSDKK